ERSPLPRSVGDAGRRRGYEGTCWAFGPANTQSEGNPGIGRRYEGTRWAFGPANTQSEGNPRIGRRCRLLADATAWITDFTLSPESSVARSSLILGSGLSAS